MPRAAQEPGGLGRAPPTLAGPPAAAPARADRLEELLVGERLRQVVLGSGLQRLDRALDRGVAGDDDQLDPGVPPRTWRTRSIPEIPGIRTSVTTRSTVIESSSASASVVLAAV